MFVFAVGAVSGFGVIPMPDDIDSWSRSASLDNEQKDIKILQIGLISMEIKLDEYIKNLSIQMDECTRRLLKEIRSWEGKDSYYSYYDYYDFESGRPS